MNEATTTESTAAVESERENDKSRGEGGIPRQGRTRNQGTDRGLNEPYNTRTLASAYLKLCRNPLQNLRGWMDAQGRQGWHHHNLPTQSGNRVAAHGGLRPIRTAGRHARSRPASTGRFSTRGIAGSYLKLCHHPLKNLRGWLDAQAPPRMTSSPHAVFQEASRTTGGRIQSDNTPTRPRFFHGLPAAGGEATTGRAGAAYQEEFNQWQPLIDAISNDLSLSPDQRAAAVVNLRASQQAAAKGAAARVAAEEAQNAKAYRRYKQALAASLALK